jgi:hypothetical protein
MVDAVPDRAGGPWAVLVAYGYDAFVGLGVLGESGQRGVGIVVEHDEDLAGKAYPRQYAVEARDDLVTFVEHRNDDRDARLSVGHTRTPRSSRFHTSTIGRVVCRSR